LTLTKRFAEAQDLKAVRSIAAEMKDRFGPLPPGADEFVRVAALRVRCARAGVCHVDVKGARAVLYGSRAREIVKVIDLKGSNARRKIAEIAAAADSVRAENGSASAD
jgi:transcription-repair coupling factor (superfamily II helicase)